MALRVRLYIKGEGDPAKLGWGVTEDLCTVCFAGGGTQYYCFSKCRRQYCRTCYNLRDVGPCVLCREEDTYGP